MHLTARIDVAQRLANDGRRFSVRKYTVVLCAGVRICGEHFVIRLAEDELCGGCKIQLQSLGAECRKAVIGIESPSGGQPFVIDNRFQHCLEVGYMETSL